MLNTVKKSQDLYKSRPWLPFLNLVIFGTMVLAVCSILPACGSDSKTADVKNEKAAAKSAKKGDSQAVMPLFNGQKALQKIPKGSGGDERFKGVTREEMEARVAASRKKFESMSGLEVLPGVTREQLEAKVAANREKFKSMSGVEVFPGVTRAQLEAKVAANSSKPFPREAEVFPGVTVEQINSKLSQQQAVPADKKRLFPPVVGKNETKK